MSRYNDKLYGENPPYPFFTLCLAICAPLLLSLLAGCGRDESPSPPPAPKVLSHTLDKGKVTLNWEKVEDAEYYRVYRGTSIDGSYQTIGTAKTPPYEDTNVTPDTKYYYKVAGVDSSGLEGKLSAPYEVLYCEGKFVIYLEGSPLDPQTPIILSESLDHCDLKLSNVGCLPLHWTIETRDDWISLSPEEGDLKPQGEQVARISIKLKEEPGEYPGTVLVKPGTGEAVTIPVRMIVAEAPRIDVEPKEFSFPECGQVCTLTIKNTGTGILSWKVQNIRNIPEWLTLDSSEGRAYPDRPGKVQLTIKSPEKPDTYTTELKLESNDESKPLLIVNVKLLVSEKPPKLCVSDEYKKVTFSPGEQSRSIRVSNCGGGELAWRVQTDPSASWLRVDPQQGRTKASQSDIINFSVDREGCIPGKTLTATVEISTSLNEVQPVVIEVICPEECWAVSADSLTLEGCALETGMIQIRNCGTEKLIWSASSDDTWITLSPRNGEIDPGITFTQQVSVDLTRLKLGSTAGKVQIETKGGKRVTLSVKAIRKACIQVKALHSRSGNLVRDVRISLEGKPPVPCPTGDCQIERELPGPFQLKAEREGYLPAIFDGSLDEMGNITAIIKGDRTTVTVKAVEMYMRPIPRASRTINDPAKPFRMPVDVCFSSDGTRAYIANDLGTVSVINALTDSVIDQVQVGVRPAGIISNPRSDEVYIADAGAHQVLILDTQSRKVVSRIDVDKYPQQLAISQDGDQLYVSCQNSGTVVIVDVRRRVPEKPSIFVGREPHGIALSSDGRRLYVACSGDNSVSVVDTPTRQVVKAIPVANSPQHLAISGDHVYVSTGLGDQVSVLSQSALKLVDNIILGSTIWLDDIAALEEPNGGDVIYVIDQTDNVLRLIDSNTLGAIDARIQLGDTPMGLAVHPDRKKIYVINNGSADITVLEF